MAPNSHPSSPRYLLAGAVLSWVGVIICVLLMQASAGGPLLLCPHATDCRAVLSSRFAMVAGIPLSVVGAGFYFAVLLTLLLALAVSSSIWRRRLVWAVLWLCVVGVTFSAGLMGVQFFVLHAFCGLCTASATVLFALTASLVFAVRSDLEDFRGLPGPAGALLVFVLTATAALYLPRAITTNSVVAEVDGHQLLRHQMEQDLRKEVWPLKVKIQNLEAEWVQQNIEKTLLDLDRQKQIARAAKPAPNAATELEPANASAEKITNDHDVRRYLEPSPPGPVAFDDRLGDVLGSKDAPVELVVFSDFTCKYCIALESVLRRIRNEFPQVKLVHRDFPLTDNGPGFLAAIAGRCAAQQGAFWAYQDKLFDERGQLPRKKLLAIAKGMGLDESRFEHCLQSSAARAAVTASCDEARIAGVPGTPALFLNGHRIGGMIDYEALRKKIRRELEAAAAFSGKKE